MKMFQCLRWITFMVFVFALGACGGGGSATPDLSPSVATGIVFDHPDTDVLAIILPKQEGDPTIVVMNDSIAGTAGRVIFTFADGTTVESVKDAGGRVGEVNISGLPSETATDLHRFVFTNYTDTEVTVTYTAPGGAVAAYLMDMTGGSKSAAPSTLKSALLRATAISNPSYDVGALIQWVGDPFTNHGVLGLWADLGEAISQVGTKIGSHLNNLLQASIEVGTTVTNKLTCQTATRTGCAQVAAAEATVLIAGLNDIEPYVETNAGINVTANSLEANRAEWDAATSAGNIPADLTVSEQVPCDKWFLAYMNPSCTTQYIPSEERGALAAADMIFETDMNMALSHNLGASLAAEYANIAAQPTNGTVTLADPVSGAFTYTPNTGFVGTDSFTYVAVNAHGTSSPGLVSITVNAVTCDNGGAGSYFYSYCDKYHETLEWFSGSATFKRFENVDGGNLTVFDTNRNSYELLIENDLITRYDISYNEENENGLRVYSEFISFNPNYADWGSHSVETTTLEGSTATVTKVTTKCTTYVSVSTTINYVWQGDTVLDNRETCPTLAKAEALAARGLSNPDMSMDHVNGSTPYQQWLAAQ